jgi:hypothetical protein
MQAHTLSSAASFITMLRNAKESRCSCSGENCPRMPKKDAEGLVKAATIGSSDRSAYMAMVAARRTMNCGSVDCVK